MLALHLRKSGQGPTYPSRKASFQGAYTGGAVAACCLTRIGCVVDVACRSLAVVVLHFGSYAAFQSSNARVVGGPTGTQAITPGEARLHVLAAPGGGVACA